MQAAGYPRSRKWPTKRRHWLKLHPVCAACGGATYLDVHHQLPLCVLFTIGRMDLELADWNLITLCANPRRQCHWRIGHGAKAWTSFNPLVVADAAVSLRLVTDLRNKYTPDLAYMLGA